MSFFLVFYISNNVLIWNDDIAIMLFTKGVEGIRPTHFIYLSNIIIGHFLVNLYQLPININFYALFLITLNFISLSTIFFCFLKRSPKKATIIYYLLIIIPISAIAFMMLNYIITASILASAALIIYLHVGFSGSKNVFYQVVFCFLFLFCGLLRPEMVYLFLLFIFPTIIYFLLKKKWIVLKMIVPALLLFTAGNLYNNIICDQDKKWAEYVGFNRDHEFLTRVPVFDTYKKAKNICDSVGWSENDYYLLRTIFLFPKDVFSHEKLHKAVELASYNKRFAEKPGYKSRLTSLIKTINNPREIRWIITYFKNVIKSDLLMVLIFIMIILLMLLSSKKTFIFPFLFFLSGLGSIFFLAAFLFVPFYLLVPIIILIVFNTAFYANMNLNWIDTHHNGLWNKTRKVLVIIFMFAVTIVSVLNIQIKNYKYSTAHKLFHQITALPANKTYISYFCYPNEYINPFNPNHNKTMYRTSNFIPFGWYINCPSYYNILKHNTIDNVMDDILYKENVMLLTNGNKNLINLIKIFYKEHYKIEVRDSLIKHIHNEYSSCIVYKLKAGDKIN